MDNTKLKKQVYETLKNIKDINSDTNIVDNKTLHEVVIDDNQINLILNIKGNSPNYLLRSLSDFLVSKEVLSGRQPGGRLGSSHPFKKA